jgi:hypothetical protein
MESPAALLGFLGCSHSSHGSSARTRPEERLRSVPPLRLTISIRRSPVDLYTGKEVLIYLYFEMGVSVALARLPGPFNPMEVIWQAC